MYHPLSVVRNNLINVGHSQLHGLLFSIISLPFLSTSVPGDQISPSTVLMLHFHWRRTVMNHSKLLPALGPWPAASSSRTYPLPTSPSLHAGSPQIPMSAAALAGSSGKIGSLSMGETGIEVHRHGAAELLRDNFRATPSTHAPRDLSAATTASTAVGSSP